MRSVDRVGVGIEQTRGLSLRELPLELAQYLTALGHLLTEQKYCRIWPSFHQKNRNQSY
ncbi:hypothetical protein HMPREF9140_01364 [Prevotella micans F0438]|uniref:Uncharacterized protein n=1 Tax=Prevotella micans F0438 TaxID=883158 RepID=H1Q376_9BACT|nr:hypothetical protein HMPREF9140_01364 [Prevotella micans F0438]